MCAGLMHQARIEPLRVRRARSVRPGRLGTLYAVNQDARLNHVFEATPGVLAETNAPTMISTFFANKRKK